MSNHILSRKPAFATLRPSPPDFIRLERSGLLPILSDFGEGQLLCRVGADSCLSGYYLYQRTNGGTTFLKVVAADHAARQSAGNDVADWVARFGVNTPIPLPNFPRRLRSNHIVFAYEYIASRFANATVTDLSKIGKSLATMHGALAQFPDKGKIQRASEARIAMLINRRNLVCSGVHSPGPEPGRLREIFSNELSIFSLLMDAPGSQPLHGDLVYGNIIFPLSGDAPVLLDFEDTLVSWFPITLDIALVLERFVLLSEKNDDVALVVCRKMLQAYQQNGNSNPRFLCYPLVECLRLLSVRALATLAELEFQGNIIDLSEWEKFFTLYDHAVARVEILSALDDEYLV